MSTLDDLRRTGPKIHPYHKSFTHYLTVGYGLVMNETWPAGLEQLLDAVRGLDTSALVIDDILDDSPMRAGSRALHELVGVKAAIVEGFALHGRAVAAAADIADRLDTPQPCQTQIFRRLNEFLLNMYAGQRLDLEARADPHFHNSMVRRYFRIISLITGSHVRLGLECGQLLAGRQPDEEVSRAGNALGLFRQLRDDLDDYFDEHHEPFGDFLLGLNRLPELLFKQDGGNRSAVLRAIHDGRADDVRALVLTRAVRHTMHEHCRTQLTRAGRVLPLPGADADLRRILSR